MLQRDFYISRIAHDGAADDPRWAARLEPAGPGQATLFQTPEELAQYLWTCTRQADVEEQAMVVSTTTGLPATPVVPGGDGAVSEWLCCTASLGAWRNKGPARELWGELVWPMPSTYESKAI